MRSDVHDLPATLLREVPADLSHADEAGSEVDVERLVPVVIGRGQQWRGSVDACIVDEDVPATERVARGLYHPMDIAAICDVGSNRDAPAADVGDLFRSALEARTLPPD